MSVPSKRKFEKQRERQKKLAHKNSATEQKAASILRKKNFAAGQKSALDRQQRLYAETFPEFVFVPGNAPPGFVDIIREAVSKLNYENREQFGKKEHSELTKDQAGELLNLLQQNTAHDEAHDHAYA